MHSFLWKKERSGKSISLPLGPLNRGFGANVREMERLFHIAATGSVVRAAVKPLVHDPVTKLVGLCKSAL